MTGFIWSKQENRKLTKLEKIQHRLIQAAKDSDIDEVRELLEDIGLTSDDYKNNPSATAKVRYAWLFPGLTMFFALAIVFLAFIWTSDG